MIAASIPPLSTCWSCGRAARGHTPRGVAVLYTVDSPRGSYELCVSCMGRDCEPRTAAPEAFPARKSTHFQREANLDLPKRTAKP